MFQETKFQEYKSEKNWKKKTQHIFSEYIKEFGA